jgi:hypothetical protein
VKKSQTSRQKSLYVVAKLYELAAEFTDSEFASMLAEQQHQATSPALIGALKSLRRLHNYPGREDQVEEGALEALQRPLLEPSESVGTAYTPESASLSAMFQDRVAFPTVAEIADVLRIPVRPKEARDRYLARVMKQIDSMPSDSRGEFFRELSSRLNTRPNSFISKWSKLIREH